MKNFLPPLCLYTFTVCATHAAFAQTHDFVYVPTLEAGITASVGALYLVPSSDFESYFAVPSPVPNPTDYNVMNVNPAYQFGIDASLGYIFDETANGVDLFFRNISTSDSDTSTFEYAVETDANVTGDLGYDLTAFDLMFSQFIELGRFMEMRMMAGLAYVELKQNRSTYAEAEKSEFAQSNQTSKFTGWGPRIGIDSRYDFFGGFGLVAGGSLAYYLGELDTTLSVSDTDTTQTATDTLDSHGVMNIRANIAFDFIVDYDDENNSFGLEAGYLFDYYDDSIGSEDVLAIPAVGSAGEVLTTSAVSFSGPYINLKLVY